MTENLLTGAPVLIAGENKLANSVAICLLLAQQPVVMLTKQIEETLAGLTTHADDILSTWGISVNMKLVTATEDLYENKGYSLAIALTNERLSEKWDVVSMLEKALSEDAVIAINTESIPLGDIQKHSKFPGRLLGANWVEPAHTTYFLEVISNDNNDLALVNNFIDHAKKYWKKDPYLVRSDLGIRGRLMCALIREAFYLVENGYVTIEDIDRACRNDAGYYLPFAGNFRYMDLMGTYIYGIVMKDMNPDLTKQHHVPDFFKSLIQHGALGMDSGSGFYEYPNGEAEKLTEQSRNFSYQIKEIIDKYHTII